MPRTLVLDGPRQLRLSAQPSRPLHEGEVRLRSRLSGRAGLFISLAAVALQAVHDAEIKLGDAVSVHGLGAIGLMTVQMCRLESIQAVIGIDPDPLRRGLAAGLGATQVLDPVDDEPLGLRVREVNDGRGVDAAIEVSGSDRGLQGALAAAGLGATVVAAGFTRVVRRMCDWARSSTTTGCR